MWIGVTLSSSSESEESELESNSAGVSLVDLEESSIWLCSTDSLGSSYKKKKLKLTRWVLIFW